MTIKVTVIFGTLKSNEILNEIKRLIWNYRNKVVKENDSTLSFKLNFQVKIVSFWLAESKSKCNITIKI